MNKQFVNPVDVDQLMGAYLPSAALHAALELGLFWRLLDGPQSADTIAEGLGIPPDRCEHWLALLAGLGLLDQEGDRYAVSAATMESIIEPNDQETWRMLAIEAREGYLAGVDLAQQISHPGSLWEAQGRMTPDYVRQMGEDLPRARRFTQMLYELHQPLAHELARTLDLSECRRLMDLGGGSGVISLELLRRYPLLSAVVVDIENVCISGREIADSLPEGERIEYLPLDFLSEELPSGFDVVIECDVGLHSEALYRNVRSSLTNGGFFVIVDKLPQAGQATTLTSLQEAFKSSLKDPAYQQQTVQDVYESLSQAGFRPVSAQSLSYGRWWMIRARPGEGAV
jgi:SAM-dependent methyltransferase